MATLILEHQGRRRGGVLNGRMVIGRQPGSHILIDDQSVSRVHAWIGRAGHIYFLADSGSRTGTIVNGRPVAGRRTLRDGDEILIGPAKLFFHDDASLPAGIEPLSTGGATTDDEGTIVECRCGAPIWVARELTNQNSRCPHCGHGISPLLSAKGQDDSHRRTNVLENPPPAPQAQIRQPSDESPDRPARVEPSTSEATCGACQSLIDPKEPTTSCPDCGVTFHANCWVENRGCSSYGCKQVGILDPKDAAKPETVLSDAPPISNPRQVQWSYVLLPASGLLGLAGMFAFGLPSLALLIGLTLHHVRRSTGGGWLLAGSQIFSAVAASAGAAFSTYWWLLPATGTGHP